MSTSVPWHEHKHNKHNTQRQTDMSVILDCPLDGVWHNNTQNMKIQFKFSRHSYSPFSPYPLRPCNEEDVFNHSRAHKAHQTHFHYSVSHRLLWTRSSSSRNKHVYVYITIRWSRIVHTLNMTPAMVVPVLTADRSSSFVLSSPAFLHHSHTFKVCCANFILLQLLWAKGTDITRRQWLSSYEVTQICKDSSLKFLIIW